MENKSIQDNIALKKIINDYIESQIMIKIKRLKE